MKSHSTFLIFVLILLGSLSAGGATGFMTYKFGIQSLRNINSPETNSSQKLVNNHQPSSPKSTTFKIIPEQDILVKVYDYVYAQKKALQGEQTSNQPSAQPGAENSPNSSPDKPPQRLQLPLQGQDRGVIIEVADINQEQGTLLLTVNLKNNGQRPVKFLYSFLDIKDEQNKSVSAIAEGLPEELPANGQNFSGTVRIPLALLNESQEISLNLTDYPDQELQLTIPSIPILR
jgi:hypothetical protein